MERQIRNTVHLPFVERPSSMTMEEGRGGGGVGSRNDQSPYAFNFCIT